MERVASVEEKIRRAEEIYERRQQKNTRQIATVNVSSKKDIKLLKKMIIQVLVCVSIYLIIYSIQNNNYVFSQDFINKVKEIISYDTNFNEIYTTTKSYIMKIINKNQENITTPTPQDGIGGAEASIEKNENSNELTNDEEKVESEVKNLSQEEQDIINIKNTTTFIKPIEGTISSKYGQRESATGRVPKNHTGTDIAATIGTKIKSATNGEVVLASEEGDYRKTFKNTNRRS